MSSPDVPALQQLRSGQNQGNAAHICIVSSHFNSLAALEAGFQTNAPISIEVVVLGMLLSSSRSCVFSMLAVHGAQARRRLPFAVRSFTAPAGAVCDNIQTRRGLAVVRRDAIISWGWPDGWDDAAVRKALGVKDGVPLKRDKDERKINRAHILLDTEAEAFALHNKFKAAQLVVSGQAIGVGFADPSIVKNWSIRTTGWPLGTDEDAVRRAMALSDDVDVIIWQPKVLPSNFRLGARIDFPTIAHAEAVVSKYTENKLVVDGREITVEYGRHGQTPLCIRVTKFKGTLADLWDSLGPAASDIISVKRTSTPRTLFVHFRTVPGAKHAKRLLQHNGITSNHASIRDLWSLTSAKGGRSD